MMRKILILFVLLSLCRYIVCRQCKITTHGTEVKCDCSDKGFRFVPKTIPGNITTLDLSGNNLSLLKNNSFRWLENVTILALRNSSITQIEVAAFAGLTKLTQLDLNSNYLRVYSLPTGVFRYISNLLLLDIALNLFRISEQYPENALRGLDKLQTLRLSGHNRVKFGKGFQSLVSLKDISVYPCDIRKFQNSTFINFNNLPIKSLYLGCKIKRVEPGTLKPFQSIQSLTIQHSFFMPISKLIIILSTLKNRNMTLVDLSTNYQAHTGSDIITPNDMAYLGDICVKEIRLRDNQISVLKSGSIMNMKYKNCIETLDISQNNVYGDFRTALELCTLSNLKVLIMSEQDRLTYQNKNFQYTFGDLHLNKTKRIQRGSFTYSFALPPKLEQLYAGKITVRSTPLANFNFLSGSHVVYFDISYTPFDTCTGIVKGLPNLKTFKMSGFNCSKLDNKMISFFKNLQFLESKSCSLYQGLKENDPSGEFLKGLTRLNSVDFTDNNLKQLHSNLFLSQRNSLRSIFLSQNKLSSIPFDVSKFTMLDTIDLRYNQIAYLNDETMKALDERSVLSHYKLHVFLRGNTFQCNCKSIKFIKWLFGTRVLLDSNGNYSCEYIDGSQKFTYEVYTHINTLSLKCASEFWLIFSSCLMVLLIIFIIVSSVAYKYRVTLQYWCLNFRRKYRLYSKMNETTNYKYNAFIAYHHDNYRWVCGPLLSFLEMEKNLSVCVHDRDFPIGVLIADNIFDAISQSKKVILVINRKFLQSTWCEYELDMARMRMFRENKDILIVILVEKIETEEMPKSLLRIWNKITCLETNQSLIMSDSPDYQDLFWSRLYESILV